MPVSLAFDRPAVAVHGIGRFMESFPRTVILLLAGIGFPLFGSSPAVGQEQPLDGNEGRDLLLRNFRPVPTLKVPQHLLKQARFPVVDMHTHFFHRLKHSADQLDHFVELMNRHNIAVCASLDGRLGETFTEHRKYLWTRYQDRFLIFVNVDWVGSGNREKPETWDCQRPGFARRVAQQLTEAKEQGASGLKLFKQFGLGYRNPDGTLMRIDDPRWDPIWKACGTLGFPVLVHTADPIAFFHPIDAANERWEELSRHPEWSFPADKFPSRGQLLAARNRVIARHPKTIFIGAHMANSSEDLATVSQWLDRYPNLYVEPASRIGELGRQPYTARKFCIKYADRILFGTDGPWPEKRLTYYWRFFETLDEYFPYSEKPFPPQGFWRIYGIGLPDAVLRKIYHENAIRLIPGLKQRVERFARRDR
ncbi:MAG: amidohydrolase family protein [Planctomycetota bacterium]|nr:amidohydrolase family protein [Planctomycetota bacterium]